MSEPIKLEWGTGVNNFIPYKEDLIVKGCRLFGDLGRIPELDERYYRQTEPRAPEADVTADSILGRLYLQRMQAFEEQLNAMQKQETQYFAFVKASLSTGSLGQVELATDWAEIENKRDALKLWLRIKDTHMGAGTGHADLLVRDLYLQYFSAKQGEAEGVSEFKKRCNELETRLTSMDATLPKEKHRALLVVARLDTSRFATLRAELDNSVYTGRSGYPDTTAAAFELATHYKVVRTGGEIGAAAGATGKSSGLTAATARDPVVMVVTADSNTKGSQDGSHATKGGNKNNDKAKEKPGKSGAESKSKSSDSSADGKEARRMWQGYKCALCHAKGEHWTDKCEYIPQARAVVKAIMECDEEKEQDKVNFAFHVEDDAYDAVF